MKNIVKVSPSLLLMKGKRKYDPVAKQTVDDAAWRTFEKYSYEQINKSPKEETRTVLPQKQ